MCITKLILCSLECYSASRSLHLQKLKTFGGADFGDAEWRFEAAKDEFSDAQFTAAVFDSDYLIGAIESLNMSKNTESFLTSEFESPKSWNGMWAALYGNHAKYIYVRSKALGGATATAVLLDDYANLLDGDAVRMKELFQSPANAGQIRLVAGTGEQFPVSYDNELALLLVICIIIAIFLNLVRDFQNIRVRWCTPQKI